MFNVSISAMEIACRLGLAVASLALVCASLIPMLHGSAWWIRIFDFPRVQIALAIVVMLAAYGGLHLLVGLWATDYAFAGAIALALGLQLFFIVPYTALYPREMLQSATRNDDNRISLLIFNVLHDNREVGALRDLIRATDPDVVLLSEPTQWWLEQLDGLEIDYPHTVFAPQANHYGKLLYSRLEMIEPEIRFLIEPRIPSLRVKLRLRSGQAVTFYGVHPRPPGLKREQSSAAGGCHGHLTEGAEPTAAGERDDSDLRDAELLLVAQEVADAAGAAAIVGGDFNDVAWSRSTRLFKRISGLLDPRVGRGLFNSFDARYPLMRYPLDHVFASTHFRLVELRRLPAIGSDHFPMLVVLDLVARSVGDSRGPEPRASDEREADRMIDEGTYRDCSAPRVRTSRPDGPGHGADQQHIAMRGVPAPSPNDAIAIQDSALRI